MDNIPQLGYLEKSFRGARNGAKRRGIEWKLSFEEFCNIWIESGFLDQRGPLAHQYVMARKGDIGPYSVENVSIQTARQNMIDGGRKPKRPPIRPTIRDLMPERYRNTATYKDYRAGTPLWYCLEKFGGVIPFARAIGCSTRQIYRWRDADGMISASAQTHAILAGRRLGIKIDPSELVYMPPMTRTARIDPSGIGHEDDGGVD